MTIDEIWAAGMNILSNLFKQLKNKIKIDFQIEIIFLLFLLDYLSQLQNINAQKLIIILILNLMFIV